MGRPKGSRNKKGSIGYPRKCECCEYVSNNPSMYHYHAQTHDEIAEGQLCDLGCGSQAKFKGTNGKYKCNEISHHCPAYLERHAEKVKNDWEGNNTRRQQTIQNMHKSILSDEAKEKARISNKARAIIKASDAKDYRSYARKCRAVAQQWARENGHIIGRETFHVDHKFSLVDAYNAKLDISIASHPANLQILEAKENARKWANSEITLEELILEIKKYDG